MRKLLLISIALLVSVLSGCATLAGNGEQNVYFDTKQKGLELRNADNDLICNLPCSLQMDGNSNRFFVVKGKGYKTKMVSVGIKASKAAYANLTVTSTFIDDLTGASTILDPYVFIELEKSK